MAVGVARLLEVQITPLWFLGLIGGLFAFVLKLVQVGWFFRLGKIPIIFIFIEDFFICYFSYICLGCP